MFIDNPVRTVVRQHRRDQRISSSRILYEYTYIPRVILLLLLLYTRFQHVIVVYIIIKCTYTLVVVIGVTVVGLC